MRSRFCGLPRISKKKTYHLHYTLIPTRHRQCTPRGLISHGHRRVRHRFRLSERMRSGRSQQLCQYQTAVYYCPSKPSTWENRTDPVQRGQRRITTQLRLLAFGLNILTQPLTGRHRKRCASSLTISSLHISWNRRKSSGFRKVRKPSGRLTYGQFIDHRSLGTG